MAAGTGVKALWRNSACLVLGSGPIRYLSKPLISDSSGLRCCVTQSDSSTHHDSEFLFVKRSFKSGFMANVHVFPGGVVDQADYSSSWSDLFSYYIKTKNIFLNFKSNSNLPIYNSVSPIDIPSEVALRICAIRETFEETGVLLLRRGDQLPLVTDLLPGSFPPSLKILPDNQLQHWRRLVHSDARNFIVMCRELECVPDVFSLIEWSNWLTPSNYMRRFDTIFYFCCMDTKPDTTHDDLEVSRVEWLSLPKGIELVKEQKLLFSPPQFAEIYSFLALESLPCIHSYALQKARLGNIRRNVSVRILCKDGSILSVTEFDDAYPIEATPYIPESLTVHHCQSPALRDIVTLQVVHSNILYEYKCTSHTAEELIQISTQMSRTNIGPDENWYDIKMIDNVISKNVMEHVQQHSTLMKKMESKL